MLRYSFYAIALVLCSNLHAQLMPFRNYGIKDGLSNNNVQAVTRDSRGLLWVGTDFGVYWFDGKRFYQPPIKANVGQLFVNSFYKDDNGVIWILTYFNGIYKYQNGRFTNFLPDSSLKNISTNSASDMVRVSVNEYVVICDGYPYLFDGRKFTVLDSVNSFLRAKTNSVAVLNDKTILVSTEYGVFLYTRENERFKLAERVLKKGTSRIVVAGKLVWVATANGLLSFDNAGTQTFSEMGRSYLPGKEIRDITADKNARIWVLTTDTVYKIENEQVAAYTKDNGLPEGLQRIYGDNEGLIWFAHLKGISMLGDEYYEFTAIKNGEKDQAVGPINTDAQSNLWIGTDNGLAIKRDSRYVFFENTGKNAIGSVGHMQKNRNGVLLAATSTGVFSVLEHSVKKELNIPATTMAEDEKERTWLGESNGRIWLYDRKQLIPLHPDQFTTEFITSLYAQNGNVWVGYRSSGIRKYKLDNDSLLLIREYSTATGYSDLRVRSCVTDTKGNIIFGTRTNGIFIFSMSSDTLIAHISVQNGLSANWIKDIKCDTDGKLYLATNSGINILWGDYKNPVIKQLKINNENINRETNSIFKTGNIFHIGTMEGILKWMPDNIYTDTVAPPVYFTHIDIQGLKNFSIYPYTENAGEISLPYEQHIISFEFVGVSLKNPENVRYQYKLEGQNNEWSPVTEYNYVAYNLKPGNYTFKVIAKNADGIVSRHPAAFHFIIKPPFWDTWWFVTACIIFVLLIGYIVYRYKVSQLLKLERLRNKISTDLHDDIGSTLSSISILSNMALKESSNTQMLEMIKSISENSTSLMEKMDDIVWSINPKNDTLENLMVRLRRFASVLLEAKNIEYSIEIDPSVKNIKLSMDYRQHIYMILKETINNMVKYANCTKAYIGVTYHNNSLEITVKDNGIGFDPKTVQYGNGILNMQHRAKQMNADIVITSGQGEGTEIRMCLKIK